MQDLDMRIQDIDVKIQEVYKRIQKERKMVEGFRAMAAATANMDTKRSCEAKVRDSEKTIEYFDTTQRDLQKKRDHLIQSFQSLEQQQLSSALSDSMGGSSSSNPGGGDSSSSIASSSSPFNSTHSNNSSTTTLQSKSNASSRKVLPPTPGDNANNGQQPYDPRYGPQHRQQPSYNNQSQQPPYGGFPLNGGASSPSIRRKSNFTNLGTSSAFGFFSRVARSMIWISIAYATPRYFSLYHA
jgi:hypothetical protein